MAFLGVPPPDLELECDLDGITVSCVHSSAGVSTSILIRDGTESGILDVGDGTLRDLIRTTRKLIPGTFDDEARSGMARIVEGIRFIALSHEHFDHSGGLLSLLSFLSMVGRRSPLVVMAPEGSGLVESLIGLFRGQRGESGYPVEYVAIRGEGEFGIDGWTIAWTRADHRDVTIDGKVGGPVPSVALRVSRKGRSVFFTGDTAFADGMVRTASGCDLAIAEGTYPEGERRPAHMSISEASEVVSAAKKGWIVHLTGASKAAIDMRRPRK